LVKERVAHEKEQFLIAFQTGNWLAEGVGRGIEDGALPAR
jgi:hypothetical protein